MKYSLFLKVYTIVVITLAGNVWAEKLSLTIDQALVTALKENSSILLSQKDVNIAEQQIKLQEGIYDLQLGMSANTRREGFEANTSGDLHRRNNINLDVSLGQQHSYGGYSSMGFHSNRFNRGVLDAEDDFKSYTSDIFVRHDVPLLKNFGSELTNLGIHKAQVNKETVEQSLKDYKQQVLGQVYRNYFLRYRAEREVAVALGIMENTKEVYSATKQKLELQSIPITDHQRVEARLLFQESRMKTLLNNQRQFEYQLLLSIYSDARVDEISSLELTTDPKARLSTMTAPPLEDTLGAVYVKDITLINLANNRRLLDADLLWAESNAKPRLDLFTEGQLNSNDSNTWSDSVSDITTKNYTVTMGLTFDFPWQNTQARSQLVIIREQIKKNSILIEQREATIRNVIQQLYEELETAKKVRRINTRFVELARENLEHALVRLRSDQGTVLDILEYQGDLDSAELDLLSAEVRYLLALGEVYYRRREMEVFMEAQG